MYMFFDGEVDNVSTTVFCILVGLLLVLIAKNQRTSYYLALASANRRPRWTAHLAAIVWIVPRVGECWARRLVDEMEGGGE